MNYRCFIMTATLCFAALSATASNGDSTIVTTHNKVVIKTNPSVGSTWYQGWGVFPAASKPIRKIYLDLTFECAPGLNCGEWDYINSIFIGKKGGKQGDSLGYEIVRYITPYGNYWNASQKWKHAWRIDVTDFSYLLRDSVQIWYMHTGYEGNTDRGWQITLTFTSIEGPPVLEPLGVQRLLALSAPYGKTGDPISNYLPEKTFKTAQGTNISRIKIIQTGHGFNTTENCAEFCSKELTATVNGNTVIKRNVWRDNCGANSLYPQAGTWLYDRANWCPGAPVEPFDGDIAVKGDSTYTFKMAMQDYENTGGSGANYAIAAYALHYKDNTLYEDVTLEDIISPSTHPDYLRYNPACSRPVVRVKNNGRNNIFHLGFDFGVSGAAKTHFDWHGSLKPGEMKDIELVSDIAWTGSSNVFEVSIGKINYVNDEYPVDNALQSRYMPVQVLPSDIYIFFSTNAAASENSYVVRDAAGHILSSKNNFSNNKTYRDTLHLMNNQCYTFDFQDTAAAPVPGALNEDGLSFWANPDAGTGTLVIRNAKTGATIKTFNADFGSSIRFQFIAGYKMDVQQPGISNASLNLYPNPSNGMVTIGYDLPETREHTDVRVLDAMGREVYAQTVATGLDQALHLDMSTHAKGIYLVILSSGSQKLVKKLMLE